MTAAFSGVAPATAASSGVGSSRNSTTLVSLKIGGSDVLVDVGLLVDQLRTTTDTAVSKPKARSELKPLAINSTVLPGVKDLLGVLPTFVAEDPDGQPEVSGAALDLANPGGALAELPAKLPAKLLDGKVVPNLLTARVNADGARSTLVSNLLDVGFLNNALTVKSVNNNSATAATSVDSNGTRTLKVGAVSLLNLGDLLKDLGIDLSALPLETVTDLLAQLGLSVPLPTGATSLKDAVATINKSIADVKAAVVASSAQNNVSQSQTLGSTVSSVGPVAQVVDALPNVVPVSSTATLPTDALLDDTIAEAIATLQGVLDTLLSTAISALGDLSLLDFEGAEVSVTTKATDRVATSAAEVTAKIGDLTVLGKKIAGVDLVSIGETLNRVTGALDGVFATLGLEKLVEVKLLEKSTGVTSSNGYVRSNAGFSILRVSINPPKELASIVGGLTGSSTSSTSILQGAGVANAAGSLPLFSGALAPLAANLNLPSALAALTQGLTLRIGAVDGLSDHKLAAASVSSPAVVTPAPATPVSPPGQQLPRTGSESTQMAVMAVGLAALALGLRRFVLRPAKG